MEANIIRYASVQYTDNKLQDYYLSGMNKKEFELSKEGGDECRSFVKMSKNFELNRVISSPMKQCIQSGNEVLRNSGLSKDLALTFEPLKNIEHNIEKLLGRKIEGIDQIEPEMLILMRTNVIKQFLEDELIESKESILKRMNLTIQNMQKNHKGSLYISHGLFMKILQLFVLTKLEGTTSDLIAVAEVEKPFFGPLEGFKVNLDI